jgi:hypothetical protein
MRNVGKLFRGQKSLPGEAQLIGLRPISGQFPDAGHPDAIGRNGISSDRAPIAAELNQPIQTTARSSSNPTRCPFALNQLVKFRAYLK